MDPWKWLPGNVNWIQLAQDSIILFKGSKNIGAMSDLFPEDAQQTIFRGFLSLFQGNTRNVL
jgi:hypothetical protein